MKKTFAICLIGFLSVLLASCGNNLNPQKYVNAITTAYDAVTTISQTTTIYDDETLISEETISIEKDTNNDITKVVIVSKRLAPINSDELYETSEVTLYYTLTAKYSNETGEWVKEDGTFASENQGFDWNLDYLDVESYDKQIKDGSVFVANVKSDKQQDFLNTDVVVSGLKVSITLDKDKKLQTTKVDYTTTNNNQVSITNAYGYEAKTLSLPI